MSRRHATKESIEIKAINPLFIDILFVVPGSVVDKGVDPVVRVDPVDNGVDPVVRVDSVDPVDSDVDSGVIVVVCVENTLLHISMFLYGNKISIFWVLIME